MRPYILAESSWKDLQTFRFELAVLPWGATEAHNYHLPYGTDIYEAEAIAAESARKAWDRGAKVTVLPVIPYGVNTGQSDIYLDMNLNPSTQMAILGDILEVLDRHGVKKFMILNSHGGNEFKSMLRELGLSFPDMLLCTTNWFQSIDSSKYFELHGDHADEKETSLMMHIRPELVWPLDIAGDGNEKKHKINAFRQGWAWTERKWSKVTGDTGIGDPSKSTADKGARYFRDVTDNFADLMIRLCELDIDDQYE